MPSSEEFRRYKELYYEEDLPLVDIDISSSKGVVTFQEGEFTIEVAGEANDFLDQIQSLVPASRNGIDQFIELRETSSKTAVGYYNNFEYFASDSSNPVLETTRQINSKEISPPTELDWRGALNASLRVDMENKDLQKVVNHYFETLAIVKSDMTKMRLLLGKIREKVSFDQTRFERYNQEALTIFQNHFDELSPLQGYREYENMCDTDTKFFAKRLKNTKKSKSAYWEALLGQEVDDEEHGGIVLFKKMNNSEGKDSKDVGQVEKDMGIEKIIGQYASIFELSRDPLNDIAKILADPDRRFESFNDSIEFLAENRAQTLTNAIERQMRHGPAHNQIDLNDEQMAVEFYNNRSKSRQLVKSIPYAQIPERYYELSDMLHGLLCAFINLDYQMSYRYLGSREFQFRMVERL